MIRPSKLNKGDKVAIVSLSNGILGMPFVAHELEIGLKRLEDYGLIPVIMSNSMKDMEYLRNHPEERASDLKQAFLDDDIKCIICAIGGDDTYKTIPYLMDDQEFIDAVNNHPKIFIGYSDTTNNHLMFNKLGLMTFYGPSFLTDIAELDNEMLPYTKDAFDKLFKTEPNYEIISSPVWYEERTNFGPDQIGVSRIEHKEEHGYETINGNGKVTGTLYGGCIESIYDAYTSERNGNEFEVYSKYNILPTIEEWKEKILFLEPSNEKPTPEKMEIILNLLKEKQILSNVKGIIVGKPMDEQYYNEYKEVFKNVFKDLTTPVLYNVNFGHSFPKTILPYGAEATIDYDEKRIFINTPILDNKKDTNIKKIKV